MALKKWWFTWGSGQEHDNCYTIIEAGSWSQAREIMFKAWGPKWCGQYDSAEAAGVERWRLRYIATEITFEKIKEEL